MTPKVNLFPTAEKPADLKEGGGFRGSRGNEIGLDKQNFKNSMEDACSRKKEPTESSESTVPVKANHNYSNPAHSLKKSENATDGKVSEKLASDQATDPWETLPVETPISPEDRDVVFYGSITPNLEDPSRWNVDLDLDTPELDGLQVTSISENALDSLSKTPLPVLSNVVMPTMTMNPKSILPENLNIPNQSMDFKNRILQVGEEGEAHLEGNGKLTKEESPILLQGSTIRPSFKLDANPILEKGSRAEKSEILNPIPAEKSFPSLGLIDFETKEIVNRNLGLRNFQPLGSQERSELASQIGVQTPVENPVNSLDVKVPAPLGEKSNEHSQESWQQSPSEQFNGNTDFNLQKLQQPDSIFSKPSHDFLVSPNPAPTTLPQLPATLQLQISQSLKSGHLLTTGRDEIFLQMEPAHLGRIQIAMEMQHGRMNARIGVESEGVRQLLENQIPALRQSLETQGIRLETMQVDIQDRHTSLMNPNGDNAESFFQRHGGMNRQQRGETENTSAFEEQSDSVSQTDTGRRWGFNTMEYLA